MVYNLIFLFSKLYQITFWDQYTSHCGVPHHIHIRSYFPAIITVLLLDTTEKWQSLCLCACLDIWIAIGLSLLITRLNT